jgi:hypothetical protein
MSVRTAAHVVSPPERPMAPPPPNPEAHTGGLGMTPQTALAVMHNLTNRVNHLEEVIARLSARVIELERSK